MSPLERWRRLRWALTGFGSMGRARGVGWWLLESVSMAVGSKPGATCGAIPHVD